MIPFPRARLFTLPLPLFFALPLVVQPSTREDARLPLSIEPLLEWIAVEVGVRDSNPPEVVSVDDVSAGVGGSGGREELLLELCPPPYPVADGDALRRFVLADGCRFDPVTQRVLVARAPNAIDPQILLREVIRATIDRRIGIEPFIAAGGDPDARAARRMVVTGFTEFIARRVLARRADAFARVASSPGESRDVRSRLTRSGASAFRVERVGSEVDLGLRFVERIHAELRAEGLRRVLADPPRSTEQVIDPEKWLGIEPKDEPSLPTARDLTARLPDGSRVVAASSLGAFEAEIVLRLCGDSIRALRAADSLDGDSVVAYSIGTTAQRLVQWRIRCDDASASLDWLHAFRKYCEKRLVEPPIRGADEPTPAEWTPREDLALELDEKALRLVVKRKSDGRVRAIAWCDDATVEFLLARDGELDLLTLVTP